MLLPQSYISLQLLQVWPNLDISTENKYKLQTTTTTTAIPSAFLSCSAVTAYHPICLRRTPVSLATDSASPGSRDMRPGTAGGPWPPSRTYRGFSSRSHTAFRICRSARSQISELLLLAMIGLSSGLFPTSSGWCVVETECLGAEPKGNDKMCERYSEISVISNFILIVGTQPCWHQG